jgi:hypothetical protein
MKEFMNKEKHYGTVNVYNKTATKNYKVKLLIKLIRLILIIII